MDVQVCSSQGRSKQRHRLKSQLHIDVFKATGCTGSHRERVYMWYIHRKKEPKIQPLLFPEFSRKGWVKTERFLGKKPEEP